jgi:regulator of nucleoside diphosphate kinase
MTTKKATRQPPIHMIDVEADTLTDLALSAKARVPEVSRQLLDEIARATVHDAARLPPDVVTMHSTVEFTDEASGTDRTIELVYPREADISAGRVSILTPVGAGLIGLRTGQSILWPDRDGRERKLTIVKVLQKAVGP